MISALVGTFLMYLLFKESNADRIRESHWWPLACVVWMVLSIFTIESWFSVLDQFGVNLPPEEYAFPIVMGVGIVAILIAYYFNIYRPKRQTQSTWRNRIRTASKQRSTTSGC